MIFETTPSQTVGPYFAIGLPFDVGPFVVPDGTPGAGVAITDPCLELLTEDPSEISVVVPHRRDVNRCLRR